MSLPGFVFVAAMAVAGCSSGTPVSLEAASAPADSASSAAGEATPVTVELRFDVTIEHQGLDLRWLEIEDSRCPTGVVCIWAGQTVVTLEVARGEDGPVELKLVRRAGREPETARALDHELRLLEVDPHPKEGVTPERGDCLARIEIVAP